MIAERLRGIQEDGHVEPDNEKTDFIGGCNQVYGLLFVGLYHKEV